MKKNCCPVLIYLLIILAGSIYDDENNLLPSAKPYSTDSTVLKNNHPLMIMVRYKQEDLLAHPLVTALLRFVHTLLILSMQSITLDSFCVPTCWLNTDVRKVREQVIKRVMAGVNFVHFNSPSLYQNSVYRHKWNTFGRVVYYFNLFIYCVFLTFLTGYIVVTEPPYKYRY